LMLVVWCCLAAALAVPIDHVPVTEHRGFGSAKHVLIIGVDGFGGMYMENATSFLPTFKRLMDSGTWTTRARNQMPTVSAPNWCTVVCGMGPEESGVFSNDWVPANDSVVDPTVEAMPPISGFGKIPEPIWAVVKNQDPTKTTAVSISWDWFNYLVDNNTVDYYFRGYEDDEAATNSMLDFIVKNAPSLMFIHLDDVDEAGHASYWGSELYYNATKVVDQFIASMLGALDDAGITEDTLVVVTADHGGWRSGHGQNSQSNFYIPLLFFGAGIRPHGQITTYATNKDISATALHALGLQPGKWFQGKVLEEVFYATD